MTHKIETHGTVEICTKPMLNLKKGAAKCLLMPKEVIKTDEAVTKVLESATKVKVVIKWLPHAIICFIK